jgi:hypothetical protein
MNLTYEEECELILRHYFGHVPLKDLAAEYGVTLKEAKKLIAEDHGVRRREQRRLEETGSSVLLSPVSIVLYHQFAKACPDIFTMEKIA